MTYLYIVVAAKDAEEAGRYVSAATQNVSDEQTFIGGIGLSPDSTLPATHYLASFHMTKNFQDLMSKAGVPSYAEVEFSHQRTLEQFLDNLGLQRITEGAL